MSIENRLAAKKRSAKARRNAKIKSIRDLCLIILIPVVVLIVIFAIYNSMLSEYSRAITKDGKIKRFDASKDITLPKLEDIKYEDVFAIDKEYIDSTMKSDMESAINALKAAEEKKEEDSDKTETPDASGSSDTNSTAADPTDTGAVTTGADTTGEDTSGDPEPPVAVAVQTDADYIKENFTDANVEKYFGKVLGEAYPHTESGYRTYVTDKLMNQAYSAAFGSYLVEYLEEKATFNKEPKKYIKALYNAQYEYFEELYDTFKSANPGASVPMYQALQFESKKALEEYCQEFAEESAKGDALLLAVYEYFDLTYTQEEVDEYIADYCADNDETKESYYKTYGKTYPVFRVKCNKAIDKMKEIIPARELPKTGEDTPETTPTPEATPEATPAGNDAE